MKSIYDKWIQDATDMYLPENYDWRLFKAQLIQGSNLDPDAMSPVGAEGIGQFMSGTWKQWAPKAGFPKEKRNDPHASIFTSACYMNYLIEEWSWPRPDIDRHCLAMASYNAGLGHILDAQKLQDNPSLYSEIIKGLKATTGPVNSSETRNYVKRILKLYSSEITS